MVGINCFMDGHQFSVISTIGSLVYLTNRSLPKGWVKSMIHRQPVIAMCLLWSGIGFAVPVIVPPIRRTLGLPSNQYDPYHPNAVFDPVYDRHVK